MKLNMKINVPTTKFLVPLVFAAVTLFTSCNKLIPPEQVISKRTESKFISRQKPLVDSNSDLAMSDQLLYYVSYFEHFKGKPLSEDQLKTLAQLDVLLDKRIKDEGGEFRNLNYGDTLYWDIHWDSYRLQSYIGLDESMLFHLRIRLDDVLGQYLRPIDRFLPQRVRVLPDLDY